MTPLRSVVVPPPMSAYHLHLPAPASAVTYDPTPGSNDLAVLLNNGSVVVFTFDQTGRADNNSIDGCIVSDLFESCYIYYS